MTSRHQGDDPSQHDLIRQDVYSANLPEAAMLNDEHAALERRLAAIATDPILGVLERSRERIAIRARLAEIYDELQLCESGWTGDRCTFRLYHEGPHSNEDDEDGPPPDINREGLPEFNGAF